MAQIRISLDDATVRAAFSILGDQNAINAALAIAVREAAPDLAARMNRAMRRAIDRTTTRRTGTLRNSPRTRVRSDGRRLVFEPNFPATIYRGRRSGQWAFVVNARRGFIPRAYAAFLADPAVGRTLSSALARELRRLVG